MSYTTRDIAKVIGLTPNQVRSYVRAGVIDPRRGTHGEYRYSFQDLVLLRTAKGLLASRVAPRKVHRALRKLREQLPTGRPLTAVQIAAYGDHVKVRDGRSVWDPESGQAELDFDVAELAREVAPLARKAAEEAREIETELDAEDWYELACELEVSAADEARDAYRRTLELDPSHADARLNLGRLLHEAGQLNAAEANYRMALAARPDNAIAAFNLGVSLEDLGRHEHAIEAYQRAIALEPEFADAYYNAARLMERLGDRTGALRHLKVYRELTEKGD